MNGTLDQFDGAFRQLFDFAPDAMLIADEAGRIVLANQMMEILFGYARQEFIGQPVEMLMPDSLRAPHARHRHSYHGDPRVRYMGEGRKLIARRKDGSEFPVEISLSPMRLSDGKRLVTSAIRDITERHKIQEALEQHAQELARSNADLEQFAYVASHDLQEPLRIVASFAQLLSRRYKGRLDAEADEFIEFIVDGATRMQALINDLLLYSRVSSRGRSPVATDAEAVVRQVLKNLQVAIAESRAEINVGSMPAVLVDPSQLAQLFQNLIANAIKFRGTAAPCIKMTAYDHGQTVEFAVHDNGIGIDPQYSERIFALFQRLHGKGDYPGTGIGLAICKKIVERHGGRIWLESQAGAGATFRFTLPKAQ